MTRHAMRVVFLALLATQVDGGAEPPLGLPQGPRTAEELADDFRTDTRARYHPTGQVDWQAGQLTLQEGAALRRDVDLGQIAELKLDVRWPALTEAAPASKLAVTFHLSGGRTAEVLIVRQRQQNTTAWEAIFSVAEAERRPRMLLRRVPFAGDSHPATLVVACRWGLLTASAADGVVARAYDESCLGEIASVSLSARRGPVDCRRWSCVGIPRLSPTPDQQRQRAAAERLQNEMTELRERGQWPEALARGEQARQLWETSRGTDHPGYAECLDGLALVHKALADYPRAEGIIRQALEIGKRMLGEDHPDFARSLDILAAVQQDTGEYVRAEALYQQELAILGRVFDEGHPQYARPLNNLATLYVEQGHFVQAEPVYRAALDLARKTAGEHSHVFAIALTNLGVLYLETGEYGRAEPLLRRAIETAEQAVGEQSPKGAKMMGNLAVLYRELGDYSKATALLTQVRNITRQAVGERHPDYALALDSLAELLHDQGEFAEAEKLVRQAVEIRKAAGGEGHPAYALSLKHLAELCRARGDWVSAERLLRQAVKIQNEKLGVSHPHYAASMGILADVYEEMGDNVKAEALYREALQGMESAFGKEHSEYVRCLNNLATFYQGRGRYDQATDCYQQVIEVLKNTRGHEHPDYATALNNLAGLYVETGAYAKAEELHRQALQIRQAWLGEGHHQTIASLHNLAIAYDCRDDMEHALPLAAEAFRRRIAFAAAMLSSYSEHEVRELFQKYEVGYSWLLGILRRQPDPDAKLAHQAVWMVRGLLTHGMARRWQTAGDQPDTLSLLRELRETQAGLAQLTLHVPAREQREPRRQRLAERDERKQSLERQLAAASVEFGRRLELDRALPADLMQRLPPDCAVVELAKTYVQDRRQPGQPVSGCWHYEGFVLRPVPGQADYRVNWVHLGASEPIDHALAQWRKAILPPTQDTRPAAPHSLGETARERVLVGPLPATGPAPPEHVLRKLVWEPIEAALPDCRVVFVVPDGELNFLPWSALPGRKPTSFLLQDYAITTVSSSRLLYELASGPTGEKTGALLVGDVAYDRRPVIVPADAPSSRSPTVKESIHWHTLPETKAEIQAIAEIWQRSENCLLLTGVAASEQALRTQLRLCGGALAAGAPGLGGVGRRSGTRVMGRDHGSRRRSANAQGASDAESRRTGVAGARSSTGRWRPEGGPDSFVEGPCGGLPAST